MMNRNVEYLDLLPINLWELPDGVKLDILILLKVEEFFRENLQHGIDVFPYESILFPTQTAHPWDEFSQFMRKAAIVYTDPLARGSDPDTYSEEVLRKERAILTTTSPAQWERVISNLCKFTNRQLSINPPIKPFKLSIVRDPSLVIFEKIHTQDILRTARRFVSDYFVIETINI